MILVYGAIASGAKCPDVKRLNMNRLPFALDASAEN